jgi:predicted nucleic acid-binding protein
MSVEHSAYLDTSALAKWYLSEVGSEQFVDYLRALDSAVISSLTTVEMRSLLSRRRRMGELSSELESEIFAVFQEDINRGWLQRYPVEEARYAEASNLITRYPNHPLRTLDALHLAQAVSTGIQQIATADEVMANAARTIGLAVTKF